MPEIHPDDAHNRALAARVHPAHWPAPRPEGRYNLVVLGGGTAGLVAALGAAGLGAKVALIEKQWLGGDCLVHGCVPSKALLASAHAAHAARGAAAMGLSTGEVEVDFGAVMARMRRIRAEIARHDAAERLRAAGVDVYFGAGRFVGEDRVAVGEHTLPFARALIATGARAARPDLPGVEAIDALDNEGIFALTERPRRLLVLGAGPVGCELAQAMQRLGSAVTLVEVASRVLRADDADAAALVANQLEADGVRLRTSAKVLRFERRGETRIAVIARGGQEERIESEAVLLAVGRAPNVEGLGLELAGVRHSRGGVEIDAYLQTTNPRIFAAGDCTTSKLRFTHAADAMARIALRNALFFGFRKLSDEVIPWATFTEPELAHVGIGQEEASRRRDVTVFEAPMSGDDRSLVEGERAGFARVYADRRGAILGATVVGHHAGELIGPLAHAMAQGHGLGSFSDSVLPYPTRMQVLKRLAGQYQRTRLTPTLAAIFRSMLAWRR